MVELIKMKTQGVFAVRQRRALIGMGFNPRDHCNKLTTTNNNVNEIETYNYENIS
jgi:hypothetical protein